MHTVFLNYDADEIVEKYPLSEGYFCQPIEGIRKNDDGSFTGFTLVTWNKNLQEAKHMNEIALKGAISYDLADEFRAWRDENPIEYDEEGNPKTETNILQTLLGWLAI